MKNYHKIFIEIKTRLRRAQPLYSSEVLGDSYEYGGTQLAKDIISSKLKAYGYKSLFAITLGPVIQFVSLPFYVFTYGSKFRKFAIATTEIGAKISKGEMGIVNWAWIGSDLFFFGEPVPITDDSDFLIIHNETVGKLAETIEEFGSSD